MEVDTKRILLNYICRFGNDIALTANNSESIILFLGWLSEQEEPPEYKEAVMSVIISYLAQCYTEATVSSLLGYSSRQVYA